MKKLFYLCAILLFSTVASAQTRTITGVVKNAQGEPVTNATVLVKGTKIGTSTNSKGSFELVVKSDAKTLIISSGVTQDSRFQPISRFSCAAHTLSGGEYRRECRWYDSRGCGPPWQPCPLQLGLCRGLGRRRSA